MNKKRLATIAHVAFTTGVILAIVGSTLGLYLGHTVLGRVGCILLLIAIPVMLTALVCCIAAGHDALDDDNYFF